MSTVAIIGASVAGWHVARGLVDRGHQGEITVVDAQPHAPYDRPPLSKEFLLGRRDAEAIRLGDPAILRGVDWRLGVEATGLREGVVDLSDGSSLEYDTAIIATGLTGRSIPDLFGSSPAGVRELRTLDDAIALRRELPGAGHVLVVGGGFIGSEVASACRELAVPVTIIEGDGVVGARMLGAHAARLTALHEEHSTGLLTGRQVLAFEGDPVTGVRLDDGSIVRGDLVVVGVGSRPATDWLAGSGLRLGHGIICDARGRTNLPGVYAAGDVAEISTEWAPHPRCFGHWSSAVEQAATIVDDLLGVVPRRPMAPYWWFDVYGSRFQVAGVISPDDEIEVRGDDRAFVAVHRAGGEPVGVVALDAARDFARARRTLVPPHADETLEWASS